MIILVIKHERFLIEIDCVFAKLIHIPKRDERKVDLGFNNKMRVDKYFGSVNYKR